jgi:hypothetical protein
VRGIDRIHLLGRGLHRLSIRILVVSSGDSESGWSINIDRTREGGRRVVETQKKKRGDLPTTTWYSPPPPAASGSVILN